MTLRSNLPSCPKSHFDLSFLRDLPDYDHAKPYYVSGALPTDLEPSRTNIQYEIRYGISVANLRGNEDKLDPATHGFQFMQLPEDVVSLDVRKDQKQEFIEGVTILVKKLLGAPFGLCYDCRFRSSSSTRLESNAVVGTAARPDTPAEAAHIDLTVHGAAKRVRRHLTEVEANEYMNANWRMRIVNVWRPFSTVEDWDLICCDFSTVQQTDLIPVDRASSGYVGEVYMLKPREHYHWYRLDHQRPNEATLFMSYDSAPRSGAPYCPHTSAKNAAAPTSGYTRESVELRIILFSPLSEAAPGDKPSTTT